jgi:hypothetical protein
MSARLSRVVVILVLLSACRSTPVLKDAELSRDELQGSVAGPASTQAPAEKAMASGFAMADASTVSRPFSMTGGVAGIETAMIIRTGTASVEIDSLETAISAARALADRVGGYVANTSIQSGRSQYRSATIEIKLPASRFDAALDGLSPLGKVEAVNVTAEDVGEEFTDLSARAANAHRLEVRLIELIATRTGKLSDVLEIERELARVREEIERMEGRMRFLKSRAAISTLSLNLHEPAPIVGDQGSWGVVLSAARQAWRNFVSLAAAIIASLGVLLPVGLVLIATVMLAKKQWRRRMA